MRQGGSYIKKKGAKKAVLKERTKQHPEGNRPRAADGTPLDGSAPSSSRNPEIKKEG